MGPTGPIPEVAFTSPSKDVAAFHHWMESSDRMRPSSIAKRMGVLMRVEVALGRPLLDSTTVELRDWLDGHKMGGNTRYTYISHLATFWTWAINDERAERDPTARLTRPKMRHGLPRPIAPADLAMLIALAPNAEIRAMVTIGGYAGLRCMEIAGLQANDVLESATPPVIVVAHGKGDKPRVVPMSSTILLALKAHGIPRGGPVFTDENGKGYSPWKISHLLREHMHACGLNASGHQLRHTFGTEVYRQSRDLRMTQQLLGHSSPATTAGYCAWAQDEAAGVVATLFT